MFLRLIFFTFISICYVKINAKMKDLQLKNHVLITSSVRDYYRASSVINVYNDKSAGLETLTTMFRLSRGFSENNVLVQSVKLSMLPQYVKYYKYRTLLPLYVLTLERQTDLDEFVNFAQNFTMSRNIWLVFIYKSPDLLRFCNNPDKNLLNVAFDTKMLVKCENNPVLNEWYSLDKEYVKLNKIAMWTNVTGFLKLNHKPIWERRGRLDGIRLRIATVKETSSQVNSKKISHDCTYDGLFGSALNELSSLLNFSVELVAKDVMYGSYQPAWGNWSGVIGRLVIGEVDIGVAEFGRSHHRLQVVDFTVPLLLNPMNLYLKEPDMAAIIWSTYAQVFDRRIYIFNVLLLAVCSIIIALMRSKFGKKHLMYLIADTFFFIWGILCQQGLPNFPTSSSLKLAFTSLFISSMVIYISYSATLTSYLTVFTPSLPFSNEKEFFADKSYNLSVLRGSVYHDIIQRSTDTVGMTMRKRLKSIDELPYNMHEAIQQLCYEKVVFYASEVFVDKVREKIPCHVMSISTGRLDSAAFTLTKRSPYRGIFNYYIENFRAVGIIQVLSRRHLRKERPSRTGYLPVNFWCIVPLLTIFLSGVCLAIFILMCERIYYFITMRNEQNQKLKIWYSYLRKS